MTDREGVITFINPEFTRLYGYTEQEVVGKTTPRVLKSGSKSPEEYASFWKTILDKRVAKEEWVNKTKDGRLVTIENAANPILDEHGGITGFLAIQRDITERKVMEEQLRQSQKMEAVGQLAGGVAHDFNNLLTVITGYSQLLLDRLRSDDPLRAHVTEIKNAGDMAAQLTQQLLAFSRRQVLAPQIVDLKTVIANVEKMLRRMIGEDIALDIVPGPDVGPVKADPWQIEQVLLNLAVNARDAMPQGGKLTFEIADIELDEAFTQRHAGSTPGPFVVLTVSDSGCGMDEQTKAHIFEPFFTTKEKGKGTGLGLAMVYGIVKQSGGYIVVQSELGKGTTFKIYLPRVNEPVAVAEPHKARVKPERGCETVLLVEDEPGLRDLARTILEVSGYTVLDARSGNEALLKCKTHKGPIHLIVTDVVMPEMNGRELAERLAALHRKMKVLYMSGYTGDAIVKRGALEPGVAFLQKPFEPDALVHKVREVLDQ
jgi:PAS domain S-box-containing protein